MINLKILISDFYNILNTKQTFFELLLNLTFILILLIIAIIFYWDSINRKIIDTSRCKIIINNDDTNYNLDIFDKDNNAKLININYDNTKSHNIKINCACPVGTTVNEFKVPYFDYIDQKVNKDLYKYCKCDKNYKDYNKLSNYNFKGDAFLVDYYKDLYKIADDIEDKDYNSRLIFPS